MQKIGLSTSTADANGEFTEGSAAGGIKATQIKAAWLNTIQRELLAVLAAAAIAPSANDDGQLLKAINGLIQKILVSATLTGTPTAPTATAGTNTDQVATMKALLQALATVGLGTGTAPLCADVDAQTTSGFFYLDTTKSANMPYTNNGFLIQSPWNGASAALQIYVAASTDKFMYRAKSGGSWRGWKDLTSSDTATALINAAKRYYAGNVVGVSSATTLLASSTGFAFNVTNPVTVTLPDPAAAGIGGTFLIRNASSGNVTVVPVSGVIYVKGSAASVVLAPNEWAEFSVSTVNYFVTGRGSLDEIGATIAAAINNTSRSFRNTPVVGIGANVALTSSQVGLNFQFNANSLTATLAPVASVGTGPSIMLRNPRPSTQTIAAASGETVVEQGSAIASFTLQPYEWVELMASGTAWWVCARGKLQEVATVDAMNTLDGLTAGQVSFFAMSTPPTGWLKSNGAAVSRTTYARLFAAIGTAYGAGDGSTTFNLPDDRGYFFRGWDDSRGIDASRTFGSVQQDQFGTHTHTGTTSAGGAHTHTVQVPRERIESGNVSTGGNAVLGDLVGDGVQSITTDAAPTHTHTITTNAAGGTETRPVNRAYLACIKF